jgi:DNA-directed RNA polymerase specialized sigma24 family protein
VEFAAAYDANVSRIHGFFAFRVATRQDVEDLTQQTFERALRAWPRYDPRRAPSSVWLLAIARNCLIDHYRAAPRAPAPVGELPEGAAGSAPPPPAPGLDPALDRALSALGDRERELLALRFGADLTGPEIAAATGLTLANVQQILSRTLRALREELARGGYERASAMTSSSAPIAAQTEI